MSKRATGGNPLDALVPGANPSPKAKARPTRSEPVPGTDGSKTKTSFNLPEDLVEQARDAAWWSRLSLAKLAEGALRREIARLAKKEGHDDGVFPPRKANLSPGRPTR